MANPIKPQWSRGRASRQAHCDLPEGTFEREMSSEGFFGPASMIHHSHPPTGWSSCDGPLRPHLFELQKLEASSSDPWQAPILLSNSSCEVRLWRLPESMTNLARNADGDQLLFIHRGAGDLYCDFGHLGFASGDYLLLPRGTAWRLESREPVTALMIEARNARYRLPDRGLVGAHAVFDQAIFDIPDVDEAFMAQQDEREWSVDIKKKGEVTKLTYPFNPLDAQGWHGDLSVSRLNIKDIRPLMSHRYHLPPSAHTTFLTDRFVVCTFVPRPFESDPGALKIPFFHSNDDYDEVLFYHDGDFFSRDDIDAGSMTLHPGGLPHGPHPKAQKRMFEQDKPATDDFAVMIDTRDPLTIGQAASSVEVENYVNSWKQS